MKFWGNPREDSRLGRAGLVSSSAGPPGSGIPGKPEKPSKNYEKTLPATLSQNPPKTIQKPSNKYPPNPPNSQNPPKTIKKPSPKPSKFPKPSKNHPKTLQKHSPNPPNRKPEGLKAAPLLVGGRRPPTYFEGLGKVFGGFGKGFWKVLGIWKVWGRVF